MHIKVYFAMVDEPNRNVYNFPFNVRLTETFKTGTWKKTQVKC